jgi:hypothetical protein
MVAAFISITVVLWIGEIFPAAYCTGPMQLQIASQCANFVWAIMFLLSPLALPIAWLLGRTMPIETGGFSRNDVSALVEVHRECAREEGKAEPFNASEEDMIKGALSLGSLNADSAAIIRPVTKTFSLSLDARLDPPTLRRLLSEGYSRVPVHFPNDERLLCGFVLVRDFITIDPSANIPVSSLVLHQPVCAGPTMPLSHLLKEFQSGSSHMAFISHNPVLLKSAIESYASSTKAALAGESPTANLDRTTALSAIQRCRVLGIVTLEDILEILLDDQVYDEVDRLQALKTVSSFMKKTAVPKLQRQISTGSRRLLPNKSQAQSEDTTNPLHSSSATTAAQGVKNTVLVASQSLLETGQRWIRPGFAHSSSEDAEEPGELTGLASTEEDSEQLEQGALDLLEASRWDGGNKF